jgi:hypothetical protein
MLINILFASQKNRHACFSYAYNVRKNDGFGRHGRSSNFSPQRIWRSPRGIVTFCSMMMYKFGYSTFSE